MFQAVLRLLPVQPTVERYVCDFEAGIWQGFRLVVDEPEIHGCVFHWNQAVWRQVQQLGLQVNTFVCLFDLIFYVPSTIFQL